MEQDTHENPASSRFPCLEFRPQFENDNNRLILIVYVDDILIAATSLEHIVNVKNQLKAEFNMRDLGKAQLFLGISIMRDREKETIFLSQTRYIQSMLSTFGLEDGKPNSLPIHQSTVRLLGENILDTPDEEYPYQELVGSLMYLVQTTRPDIAFAVGYLARYFRGYGEYHFKAAKALLRYLKHTKNLGLVL